MSENQVSGIMVESVKAPQLHSLHEVDVQEFLSKREMYQRQIATLRDTQAGMAELLPKKIKDTLPRSILSMIALIYGNGQSWEEISEERVLEILKEIGGISNLDKKGSTRAKLRSLAKMNQSIASAKDRVNEQFSKMYTYLHDQGILSEFHHEGQWIEGPAEVYSNAMVHGAWPDSLKSEILSEVAFNKELLKNPSALFKTMMSLASGHDRWIGLKRERHGEHEQHRRPRKMRKNYSKKPRSNDKSALQKPKSDITCDYCQKKGHKAVECWAKDPNKRPDWLKAKNKLSRNVFTAKPDQKSGRYSQKSGTSGMAERESA